MLQPLHVETGDPVVFRKTYSLRKMYELLADNTENGLEGPQVWSEATHQWNRIPTYQPYLHVGFATISNDA